MLPPQLPNPNLLSPFPLPPIEDIRPYLWSQRLLTSLSVNQTRGQLVHCPYYKPFSSLDQGAPAPPFLATADHYFEWRSIYTNQLSGPLFTLSSTAPKVESTGANINPGTNHNHKQLLVVASSGRCSCCTTGLTR